MVTTKVGYCGGKKENPTYEDLGDHTEVIQIEFNPNIITYDQLLEKFLEFHNPTRQSLLKQYMSVIFYYDQAQYKKAIEVRDRKEKEINIEIITELSPYDKFYLAEFYHQKYYLQANKEAMLLLQRIFKTPQDFLKSPLVTKLNGEILAIPPGEFMMKIKKLLQKY